MKTLDRIAIDHAQAGRAHQLLVLKKLGVPLKPVYKADFRKELRAADVTVDALFGTGLSKDIEEPFRSAIEAITFGAPKKGFKQKNGPRMAGKVIVKSISLPPQLLKGKK